ncbi:MAG TPA: alpha-galactosidase [Planctomycetes bacterium]|nr:alpha-galactosidase [Planctomycetota bacterium]
MIHSITCLLVLMLPALDSRELISDLPAEPRLTLEERTDWLIDPTPYRAGVFRGNSADEIVLSNGLVRRTFRIAPNLATVAIDNLVTGESVLRSVRPEAQVVIDGDSFDVGGLIGQPNHAFLREEWIDDMESDPTAFQFLRFEIGTPVQRIEWKQVRHHAPDVQWPPRGVSLRFDLIAPRSSGIDDGNDESVMISIHYELYDGIPCFSKWLNVHNRTAQKITIDRFTSEIIAAVEHTSRVEDRSVHYPPPDLLVETDYAFSGMDPETVARYSVHWESDPMFSSQVNYLRNTPCLLKVQPTVGPDQDLDPGEQFVSFRAFVLPLDGSDRERKGLARRRMYRIISPWTTENPLMMHARYADWDRIKLAIDQCAEVGFEMVIMTFGSGFQIENESDEYIEKMKGYADYARSKGVEIGGYSLLSSRSIGGGNDIVSPEGTSPTHGSSPALASDWGQEYFRKLYQFYEKTGMRLLEHDGSYPGDIDVTERLPLQKGEKDSRWVQWRIITDFYKWCRANGVYLNVPDYYYLTGSSKCAMGYREVNWSLPRDQQVIHTRQNIYDGTWTKNGSMGWMFVPLTQYHGGGAAATIEPLSQHIDHYQRIMMSNLGAGVQACYRGPRLFDTPETRTMVKDSVDWFKKHRQVLEGDLIHLRRADARDLDYWLMVNPTAEEKGLLMLFNPLDETTTKELRIPLYYTGLVESAILRVEDGSPQAIELRRDGTIDLDVTVSAGGYSWITFE